MTNIADYRDQRIICTINDATFQKFAYLIDESNGSLAAFKFLNLVSQKTVLENIEWVNPEIGVSDFMYEILTLEPPMVEIFCRRWNITDNTTKETIVKYAAEDEHLGHVLSVLANDLAAKSFK